MRDVILKALEDKYNADISEAEANLKIYLEKPVGIGEHPQHIDEVDKLSINLEQNGKWNPRYWYNQKFYLDLIFHKICVYIFLFYRYRW